MGQLSTKWIEQYEYGAKRNDESVKFTKSRSCTLSVWIGYCSDRCSVCRPIRSPPMHILYGIKTLTRQQLNMNKTTNEGSQILI